jgi:hypothetical protein
MSTSVYAMTVDTYQVFPMKIHVSACSHCHGRRLYVAKYNVSLATHLHCLQRHNIEDRSIRREEQIEFPPQSVLLQLFRETSHIEPK